jgi:peroxiredoxin
MSQQEKRISVGEDAKDFTLNDHRGQEFQLSQLSGRKILLSFHPLAWTNICAEQMKSLESHVESFDDLNTTAVGVSVDSVPCKQAWAKSLGIKNTSLLSDFWPHGRIAKLYGIFREKNGFSERANILIDEHQKIRFVKIYGITTLPDIQEIIEVLKE